MADKADHFYFTDDTDLTDSQIEETINYYLRNAKKYADSVERVADAGSRIQSLTLFPFLEKYRQLNHRLPILFVGAGSGRDLQTTEKEGIPAIGIDISPEMVRLAKSFGVTSPYFVMDMREIAFQSHSLAGIFCETAISHIQKVSQMETLHRFYNLLIPNGLLFLGVRLGDGRVFCVDDQEGGKRYNTSLTRSDYEKMIKKTGFNIVASPEYEIANRPKMIDYILQKPA